MAKDSKITAEEAFGGVSDFKGWGTKPCRYSQTAKKAGKKCPYYHEMEQVNPDEMKEENNHKVTFEEAFGGPSDFQGMGKR